MGGSVALASRFDVMGVAASRHLYQPQGRVSGDCPADYNTTQFGEFWSAQSTPTRLWLAVTRRQLLLKVLKQLD